MTFEVTHVDMVLSAIAAERRSQELRLKSEGRFELTCASSDLSPSHKLAALAEELISISEDWAHAGYPGTEPASDDASHERELVASFRTSAEKAEAESTPRRWRRRTRY